MSLNYNVKKIVPMFLLVFLSSAIIISVCNIIAPQIMMDFEIDSATVSLLSMITMLAMGVGSVAYSMLSDFISIKKLMIFGIILLNVGALLTYLFSQINFYLMLISVAIMIFGGTCGSGLFIITVTRFLPEQEHAKYYGYNTACVSVSQALGTLLGGLFATYIGWKFIFLLPIISIIAIPAMKKYAPEEIANPDKKLDIIGLSLFSLFTLVISLFFNLNSYLLLILAIILFLIFLIYIKKSSIAFISIDFFKNLNYMILILLVIFVFGLQLAYSFLFPFLGQGIYNLTLDKISMIILPSFIVAAIAGANSGKLVEKVGSYKTLILALTLAVFSTLFTAFTCDKGMIWLCLSASLYAGSFAFVYAPFLKLIIGTLEADKIGMGIGLFNLMTGIGPSLMIVLTGNLLNKQTIFLNFSFIQSNALIFSNILIIFALIFFLSIFILIIKKKTYLK